MAIGWRGECAPLALTPGAEPIEDGVGSLSVDDDILGGRRSAHDWFGVVLVKAVSPGEYVKAFAVTASCGPAGKKRGGA